MARWLGALLGALIATGATGCGEDCVSLCEEAQSRDCTSIEGNCATGCANLDKTSANAGCEDQRSAYESCIGDDDVCTGDARCGSEENALAKCLTPYCMEHTGECEKIDAQL